MPHLSHQAIHIPSSWFFSSQSPLSPSFKSHPPQDVRCSPCLALTPSDNPTRYAFRRSAARLLTARPATFLPTSRSYISVVAPPTRTVKPYPTHLFSRRWATTDSQSEGEARQPTASPEVETSVEDHQAQSSVGSPSDSAPAIAESANLTEATEESYSAAETGERPSQSQGIVAEGAQDPRDSAADGSGMFSPKPTVYVGNLFFDVTESDLVKEFTRFGTVVRAKIIRDSRGLSKGCASFLHLRLLTRSTDLL